MATVTVMMPGGPSTPAPTVAVRVDPGPHFVGQGIGVVLSLVGPADARPAIEPPRIAGGELLTLAAAAQNDMTPRKFRFVLVPDRAGECKLGSFHIRLTEGRTIASRPVTLSIRTIPQPGRTAAFRGGVGRCQVAAAVEPARVRVGQPVVFRIMLTGPGAWGSVQPPDLSAWSDLAAAFEVRLAANQVAPAEPATRTVRYQLRTTRPGRVVLPPVAVATFDPSSGKFQTQVSPSLPLEVEPPPRFDPANVVLDGPDRESPRPPTWAAATGMAAALGGVAVAAYALLRPIRAARRGGPAAWRREAAELERRARRGLATIAEVDRRLTRQLARATGRPLAVLTPADAEAAVLGLTGDEDLARRLGRLVATTDRLRFDAAISGLATEAAAPIDEAVAMFRAIGRSVRPSRPDRPSGKHPEVRGKGRSSRGGDQRRA